MFLLEKPQSPHRCLVSAFSLPLTTASLVVFSAVYTIEESTVLKVNYYFMATNHCWQIISS